MASIKVKFRPSSVVDKEGRIYYQVIHKRVVRQLWTPHTVYNREWNMRESMPALHMGDAEREEYVRSVISKIRYDMYRLSVIVRKREYSGIDYSSDEIIEDFERISRQGSFVYYMQAQITRMKNHFKIRTAETYTAAMRSFLRYLDNGDIMLDCMSSDLMQGYEAYLRSCGNVPNTISFYMRILRAVYNHAVEHGVVDDRFPFRHVYTGIDKTIKRALPLRYIKKINALDLSSYPNLEFARDMFMMSFFMRGMSFIDMAFLRKSDLKYGYISYRRRKTGKLLTIAWTEEMQQLLRKYPGNDTEYLLPIITKKGVSEYAFYRNIAGRINYNLKIIGGMVGVRIPITLYCARHSWASAAKAKGIPVSVISEGMGHDSESTTQIYLASLDNSVVDKANAIILKSI